MIRYQYCLTCKTITVAKPLSSCDKITKFKLIMIRDNFKFTSRLKTIESNFHLKSKQKTYEHTHTNFC